MVNHGISRGCEVCKSRRKKCDETRPFCNRCTKSKRNCPGYRDDVDLVIRQYHGDFNDRRVHRPSVKPLKAPAQTFPTASRNLSQDFQAASIEQHALAAFFHDYCIVSTNHSLSRGYFDGLESLLHHARPSSDIARACRIVAFASLSNKTHSSALLDNARMLYPCLLRSFQLSIANPTTSHTVESLMTAVLLGLYETIVATDARPNNYSAHSRGVCAILRTDNSPFDMLNNVRVWQVANPLFLKEPPSQSQTLGILCNFSSQYSAEGLDAFVDRIRPLYPRAYDLLSSTESRPEDLNQFIRDATWVFKESSNWPALQPKEWAPRKLGSIGDRKDGDTPAVGFWPENADAYFDLYVAAIWNSYRKGRLKILDCIIRCAKRLGQGDNYHQEQIEAEELANDIVASIPYHLTADLQVFVQEAKSDSKVVTPGKALGGLLLMHPLFVTSELSIVSPELRTYMRACLAWIGSNMGIGQATLLSRDPPSVASGSIADAYVLIWAGMLIQPV